MTASATRITMTRTYSRLMSASDVQQYDPDDRGSDEADGADDDGEPSPHAASGKRLRPVTVSGPGAIFDRSEIMRSPGRCVKGLDLARGAAVLATHRLLSCAAVGACPPCWRRSVVGKAVVGGPQSGIELATGVLHPRQINEGARLRQLISKRLHLCRVHLHVARRKPIHRTPHPSPPVFQTHPGTAPGMPADRHTPSPGHAPGRDRLPRRRRRARRHRRPG